MIRMLGIAVIAGIKTMLCKGSALGIFILLFWLKGRRLKFNSEQWEDFFLQMSAQTTERYVIAIYLAAAGISSVVGYGMLVLSGYDHSVEIAVAIFVGGLVFTACKWYAKGREHLSGRYQEIVETILEKRENGKISH